MKPILYAGLVLVLLAGGFAVLRGGGTPAGPDPDPVFQADPGLAPTYEVDAAWPKQLPNNWILGQVSGAAVDSRRAVTYHSACSMQHGQNIRTEPKALLTAAGFVVKDVPEGHLCCGSAGTYNILQPELARQLRDRKVANIERVKRRADEVLVEQGLAPTRSKARALIMAGQVRIGDRVIDKAGASVAPDARLEIRESPRYVSRGGEKLTHALDEFGIHPKGLICADFGASTGGFTDVLLQREVARVYAIDVGYGQLDYQLRNDSRVIVMERTNARHLESLPDPIDLVVTDVSFISLTQMFPAVSRVLRTNDGMCLALVKPQFEAGRGQVGRGGVVRDPGVHRAVLHRVASEATEFGLFPRSVTRSPITGPKGNLEFLMKFDRHAPSGTSIGDQIDRLFEPDGTNDG
jgi:23S rRNA (cytidine1920-2'-O)/16S rRNA (cytidine1409-2'-O)-methyltransferase